MSTDDRQRDRVDRLLGSTEEEVSCSDCFELLDQHVELELELGAAEADTRVPGFRAHLRGCPACREDHQSLLDLVGAQMTSWG